MDYNSQYSFERIDIETLVGKTITTIKQEDKQDLYFTCSSGEQYILGHCQDCCENVTIEDICGDLDDLIGSPIVMAEEVSSEDPEDFDKNNYDSYTWTFYKLGTAKGTVTIRFFGSSNGYYSESVDLFEIKKWD
jgi:hypothetical protein